MQKGEEWVRRKARIESCGRGELWMLLGIEKDIAPPHDHDEANGDEKKGQCPDQSRRTCGRREVC